MKRIVRNVFQNQFQWTLFFCWSCVYFSYAYEPIEYVTGRLDYIKSETSLEPIVIIHKPSGISFTFERAGNIMQFIYHMNINHPFNGSVPYLMGDVTDVKANLDSESPFECRNDRIKLKAGDKVYYWYVLMMSGFTEYVNTNISFEVKEDEKGEFYPEPFPSYHIVNEPDWYSGEK